MTSAPPIGFEYRGSRALILALLALAALALAAIHLADLPLSLQLVLVVLVVGGAGTQVRKLLRPRIASLLWREGEHVALRLHAAPGEAPAAATGRLLAGHVLGGLITLRLALGEGGRETLWLLPDNLDADIRRRLRVRLRAAAPGQQGARN